MIKIIKSFYYGFIYNKEYGVGDTPPKSKKYSELDSLDVFNAKNQIKFISAIVKFLKS